MKKQAPLLLAMVLSMAFHTSKSAASVLWYGDPSYTVQQDFYSFNTTAGPAGTCPNYNPNDPAACGVIENTIYNRMVWTVHKPAGIERAELSQTDGTKEKYVPTQGNNIYVGYHWMIDTSPALKTGLIVFQWKSGASDNKQDYPFKLSYDGTTLSLQCTGPLYNGGIGTGSVEKYTTTIWSQNVALGQWVSLEFHVNVSTNATGSNRGYIQVWFNGQGKNLNLTTDQQKLTNSNTDGLCGVTLSSDNLTAYCCTLDVGGNYMKWGAYDAGACQYITQTFYDEMRVGTTFDDANPDHP